MKTILVVMAFAVATPLAAQECPLHAEHMRAVQERHESLGVPHDAAHHQFRMLDDGAAIELHADSAKDADTIAMIRKHMRMIASQFAANDFSTPMFVHDKTPDGVETMKRLHSDIEYRYERLRDGARVRMKSANAEAVGAMHDFMRFQSVEHDR